jgi:hypothetical protein
MAVRREVGRHSLSVAWRAEMMTAYPLPPSGPDEPSSLSPREWEILAGIEHDLSTADPALARKLSRRISTTWKASPVPFSKGGALVVGSLVLTVTAVLAPATPLLLLVLLTVFVVLPWLLLRTIERPNLD